MNQLPPHTPLICLQCSLTHRLGRPPCYTRVKQRPETGILDTHGDRLLEPSELAQHIADLLSDRQAEDIVLMDIGKVSTFTDYFIVATANNPRQMNALIESLDTDLRDKGIRPSKVEGASGSGWVLIDFGDAIVHLFSPDERRYYNLEALWSKGVSVVHMQ